MQDTTNKKIIVMSIIGIIFSVAGLLTSSLEALIMLFVIPLALSILFLIRKHPAYGIVYTILFFINRISLFTSRSGGTLLGYIIIIGLLIFFIYVDHQSYIRWKEIKDGQDKGC